MTEETKTEETKTAEAAAAAPAAKPTPPKRTKVVLTLTDAAGNVIPAYVYPMIRRGPQFFLKVNGEVTQGANTTFGEIRKAVFEFGGSCFGIDRHLVADAEYTFQYPEGYDFKPPMTRREEDARALKKKEEKAKAAGLPWPPVKAERPAKAPKAPKAEGVDAGAESPPEGANASAEGVATDSGSEGSTAPESAPKKGKKAQR